MNLQEALDYRNKCIICQREMNLKIYGVADHLKISKDDNGIKIGTTHKNGVSYLFKYDGTYECKGFYSKPFLIKKSCPVCTSIINNDKAILYKGRTAGLTTMSAKDMSNFHSKFTAINNVKKQSCFYSFNLSHNPSGTYEVSLVFDNIRYSNKEEFWHLNTDFTRNENERSKLHHAKFADTIDQILNLKLPAVNTINIKTKEQFISKFKLYTLFS
jgi:hypothetical protein